jgi:hypothetical protein
MYLNKCEHYNTCNRAGLQLLSKGWSALMRSHLIDQRLVDTCSQSHGMESAGPECHVTAFTGGIYT